jgi:pyridoxamine 5'-phosphate oxidase
MATPTASASATAASPFLAALSRSIARNAAERSSTWFSLATVRRDGRPAVRTVVHRGFFRGDEGVKIATDARSEKVRDLLAGHTSASPASSSFAELAWYFPSTREQWRIAGRLSLVLDPAAAEQARVPAVLDNTLGSGGRRWSGGGGGGGAGAASGAGEVPSPSPSPSQPPKSSLLVEEELQRERAALWASMSDAARAQFAWPSPGSVRTEEGEAMASLRALPAAGGAAAAAPEGASAAAAVGLVDIGTAGSPSPSSSAPAPSSAEPPSSSLYGFASREALDGAVQAAYASFALLILSVESADHLCLTHPQRRMVYRRTEGGEGGDGAQRWSVVEVNP